MRATDQHQSRAMQVRPNLTRTVANPFIGQEGLTALWFGEPDVPTPKFICDAAADSMANGETFYTPGLGEGYLRAAIATYVSELHNSSLGEERIAVTVSGGNALNLAFQCVLEQGDLVGTHIPAFPNLLSIPTLQGARLETIRVEPKEQGWQIDMDQLIDLARRCKVLLINSPSNPTGWVMHREQQLALLEACRQYGTWIISDEVYSRIFFSGKAAPSFLEISEPEDRVIVVNSFSKAWAMTGWRLGWLTVPESLLSTLENIMEFSISSAPAFAQRAGKVALEEGEDFVRESVARYEKNLATVTKSFADCERINFTVPESTFYAYFQIDGVSDNLAFIRQLIEQSGLGLAPGLTFDPDSRNWFRLCFAATEEKLEVALGKLTNHLAKSGN